MTDTVTSQNVDFSSWDTLYLMKSPSYEVSHYVVFSNLLPFRPPSVQIFSLEPCSQMLSVHLCINCIIKYYYAEILTSEG
jgi:hypothetical protein